jgi:hypothetical protein
LVDHGPEAPDFVTSRHLEFDTIFNFRDLGGYQAAGDRTVRWRTLFRADGLHRLSGDDLARCAELGIRTVLDLRTHIELDDGGRFGDRAGGHGPVDIRYHHLPFIRQTWERDDVAFGADPARYLADRYLDMLAEGRDAIGDALRIIADPASVPLAFHCAAGKDRTGVLAALTLSLLGVDDDTVAVDYGLSRLGMDRLKSWVMTERPELANVMVDQPKAWMDAPDDAMRLFLRDLRRSFGSVEAYVGSVGVDAAALRSLRHHLLI